MYDIGVAITGTGFMGPAHTEALRRLGVRVEGILGSSPEKSRRFAQAHGIAKAYASFEELLADDAAHIRLIFDQQYEFATMGQDRFFAGLVGFRLRCSQRQDHQNRGALIQLALDRDAAARLFGKAVGHG